MRRSTRAIEDGHGMYLARWFLAETKAAKRRASAALERLESEHPWLTMTRAERMPGDLEEALRLMRPLVDYLQDTIADERDVALLADAQAYLGRMGR